MFLAHLKAHDGLVDESRNDAVLNFLLFQAKIPLDEVLGVLPDLGADGLLGLRVLEIVGVKALAALASEPTLLDHVAHEADVTAGHSNAQIRLHRAKRGAF
tara:strand:+ start:271 stop:573 length:303 start_codon:yes stop_codon:yes gene_type:complete